MQTQISKELYEYLKKDWKKCNHTKYHKYFDEWVSNITDDQIHYYTIQMNKPNITE